MSPYSEFATTFGIWFAAGLTIAIYSFLYKDNPFYKLAEHVYIGASTGYLIVIAWRDALEPLLFKPLTQNPQGLEYLVIVPGLLGIMMFTRFIKKVAWVSRISLAYIIGWGSGVAAPVVIQGFIIRHTGSTIMPIFNQNQFDWNVASVIFALLSVGFFGYLVYCVQKDKYADFELGRRLIIILGTVFSILFFFISAVFFANVGPGDVWNYFIHGDISKVTELKASLGAFMTTFCNLSIIVGVISVLFYFFYSIEHKKALKGVAKTGILYLMVFFGAAFGYTVMGRVSLAIGRMRFLVNDWIKTSTLSQWGIGIIVCILIALFLLWQERSRPGSEA